MTRPYALVAAVAAASFTFVFTATASAVTPGWECVPTTAGQPVISGGTGSAPSCGSGTTAVLAPTYVASGVAGKPTAEFSGVNIQIVNGTGATATANGAGNLVLGYDEVPGAQTGSHDLVLGQHNAFTSYADLIVGFADTTTGAYATALGATNIVSGAYSTVTGGSNNTATSTNTAVSGGRFNDAAASEASISGGIYGTVKDAYGTISGGCSNLVGVGTVSLNAACESTTTFAGDFASVSGGAGNHATGTDASILGGELEALGVPNDSQAGASVFTP